jgi:hypothetical protein
MLKTEFPHESIHSIAINELLTVNEVAVRLRVKVSWVYANADKLGVVRVGKYLRFLWPIVLERLGNASTGFADSKQTAS